MTILTYNIYFSYPSSFIIQQFGKFFDQYIYPTSFLPFIENEQQFLLMRHDVMDTPTPRQSQVATRAATADTDNDQTDETVAQAKESTKKTDRNPTNYGD